MERRGAAEPLAVPLPHHSRSRRATAMRTHLFRAVRGGENGRNEAGRSRTSSPDGAPVLALSEPASGPPPSPPRRKNESAILACGTINGPTRHHPARPRTDWDRAAAGLRFVAAGRTHATEPLPPTRFPVPLMRALVPHRCTAAADHRGGPPQRLPVMYTSTILAGRRPPPDRPVRHRTQPSPRDDTVIPAYLISVNYQAELSIQPIT